MKFVYGAKEISVIHSVGGRRIYSIPLQQGDRSAFGVNGATADDMVAFTSELVGRACDANPKDTNLSALYLALKTYEESVRADAMLAEEDEESSDSAAGS